MRRICYISGTRADFGLMRATLYQIARHPSLTLEVVVTGTHLSTAHGSTMNEIIEAGLTIATKIEIDLSQNDGAAMARNIGCMTIGFVDAFERCRPDVVLILGDRGEMLAAAVAALHLNLPIVHIHGGERSGTVDEPVRHAISKLAHIHFVATGDARDRLVRMGENAVNVMVTGAPGLDGLSEAATVPRATLCEQLGFNPSRKIALFVFHPVLTEARDAGAQTGILMTSLLEQGLQVVALRPNADAGSSAVNDALDQFESNSDVRVVRHFPRSVFVSWMAAADVMVGNSSSGIIEAATFGIPVLNVGSRQNLRERNKNVTDVGFEKTSFIRALASALQHGKFEKNNCYGDGQAGVRITELLANFPLSRDLLAKCNSY